MSDRPQSPMPPGGDLPPDHVEDDLGVAATVAGTRGRRRDSPAAGDGHAAGPARSRRRLPRPGPKLTAALVVVALVALALVPTAGSVLQKTPRDKVGISYGGGLVEGARFQQIVQPGSGLFFNGFGDSLYLYPADQRNYIVSEVEGEGDNEGTDSITAPTGDRVQISYQVAVYYKLNTDLLRPFHEQLGLKHRAYTDAGWAQLIQDTFRQNIENALQEQTRRHDVAEIFGDADVLLDLQQEVEATLGERLEAALGQDFFCAPTFSPGGRCDDPVFVVKQIDLPQTVIDAFEANRTSEVEVLTREAEARGIDALAEALDRAGDQYVLLRAIESGQITFWVLPDDGGVAITAPDGSTEAVAPADAPAATTAPGGGGGGGGGG